MKLAENKQYKEFVKSISSIYSQAVKNSVSAVNVEMLNSYWEIGKYIVDFERGAFNYATSHIRGSLCSIIGITK